MDEWIVGIDLGTSSLKALCVSRSGETISASCDYGADEGTLGRIAPYRWLEAVKRTFGLLSLKIDLQDITAIGLSAQVGTYILHSPGMEHSNLPGVSWRDSCGAEQLSRLKAAYPKEYFIKHISMPHPELISYPAPRIQWFRQEMHREWEVADMILQPKDYLYNMLTGLFASDPYSWRGFANLHDANFHDEFLCALSVPRSKLPMLYKPWDAPGSLLPEAASELGLKAGMPVYLGCNDFFASLLGMGVISPGQRFDMTGTSEHIGMISESLDSDTRLVCGPYFEGFAHYGVTANSGTSIAWAMDIFGGDSVEGINPEAMLFGEVKPPIFLPYMRGERAPIWDGNARGVFFGLESGHTRAELAYSVLEGVAFSLRHIWQGLPAGGRTGFLVAGGAARNGGLNSIKASLFRQPFVVMREKNSAALGAAMLAAVGRGWFASLGEATSKWVKEDYEVLPDERLAGILQKRFDVYTSLYPVLKDSFRCWSECI